MRYWVPLSNLSTVSRFYNNDLFLVKCLYNMYYIKCWLHLVRLLKPLKSLLLCMCEKYFTLMGRCYLHTNFHSSSLSVKFNTSTFLHASTFNHPCQKICHSVPTCLQSSCKLLLKLCIVSRAQGVPLTNVCIAYTWHNQVRFDPNKKNSLLARVHSSVVLSQFQNRNMI